MTTYEEWRVTGQPAPHGGLTYPPYEFTWSPVRGDKDPEQSARAFMNMRLFADEWTDGPHLHKRTVTVTEWTEVDG